MESSEHGHSWRGFCSAWDSGSSGVRETYQSTKCEVKSKRELKTGCDFQLWYLSQALSAIRNYSGEFKERELVPCLASFVGLPRKESESLLAAFLFSPVWAGTCVSERQQEGCPCLVGSPSPGPAPALLSPVGAAGGKLCKVGGGNLETGCCLEDEKADVIQHLITWSRNNFTSRSVLLHNVRSQPWAGVSIGSCQITLVTCPGLPIDFFFFLLFLPSFIDSLTHSLTGLCSYQHSVANI